MTLPHGSAWYPPRRRSGLLSLGRRVGAAHGDVGGIRRAPRVAWRTRVRPRLDAQNLPQEVNRDRQAIHALEGCYLGQETVARIDALGHVNRLLVRLRFPKGRLPEPGCALVAIRPPERPVGQVTSVAQLDDARDAVGLGYVRHEHASDGSLLRLSRGSCAGPFTSKGLTQGGQGLTPSTLSRRDSLDRASWHINPSSSRKRVSHWGHNPLAGASCLYFQKLERKWACPATELPETAATRSS